MRLPTGRQIAAARTLLGLHQKELAALAGLDVTTVNRMEQSGPGPIRGHGRSIQAVMDALERKGAELTADGVRLVGKPRR
jgi:transcriptional regulator with XRE-family HTH domain